MSESPATPDHAIGPGGPDDAIGPGGPDDAIGPGGPDDAIGRVASDGTVYVRTAAGERVVGQWPGGDPVAALTFYRNRYDGLVTQVDLLEKRLASGAVSPQDATRAVGRLRDTIAEAPAVGDLDALAARVEALAPAVERARDVQRADRAARAEQVAAQRKALVVQAEAVAAGKDWAGGAARLSALVEQWKALPRPDKSRDDQLWQRLSAARTSYTKRRRQHFAELDERRKTAAAAKEKLIAEAEQLAGSTDCGTTTRAFRDLMTRWKAAGPARRDQEDALWKRFRAAQDTFFMARDAKTAQTDAAYAANADVKRALLADAEALLPVREPRAAREAFRALATRWDAAGKVPRQDIKDLEGRFSRVDEQIRRAEEDRWRRSNPEAAARAAATVAQLEAAIASAHARLSAAAERGDERAEEQARSDIEAREAWLDQARATHKEFSS